MKFFGYSLGAVEMLISLNVILFLVSISSQDFVISNFGLLPSSTLERPWTLITSMFLHADFGHLFANMLTLFFFGLYVEQLAGEKEFLKIYFLGGLAGSLFFVLLAYDSPIPAVGASGAIFAIGGTLAVLRPHLQVIVFPIPVPISLWIAILLGFVFLSFISFVAWQAHLGGLIVGLIFGYILKKRYSAPVFF